MQTISKKTIVLYVVLMSTFLLQGCTNWKKKYQNLDVEHQNLKGLYERAQAEKGQLSEQVSQSQMTIDELQRKIAEKQSAAKASGFGDGYDVRFDAAAGTITVTLPNTILFSPGKALLKKSTSVELDHIRSVLQSKYAGKEIEVAGHTDSDPIKKSKWKDNWELSAQRALTVLRYLVARGIPEDKIKATGCGASRPIASNTTSSGKSRNRRVEVIVHIR